MSRRLAALFANEGMVAAEAPRPRVHRGLEEPMQYADALHNDLWGMAVFPGAPSWTVVKTAPLELLAERSSGAERMRVAEVCAELRASAIQVNLYDSIGIVLVEVSSEGEVLLSGFNPLGKDNFGWHAERLAEETYLPQFRIHPFGDLIQGTRADDIPRGLAARLGGANAEFCDNLVSVDTLITHKPLAARGGAVSYFRWQGPSRLRSAAVP